MIDFVASSDILIVKEKYHTNGNTKSWKENAQRIIKIPNTFLPIAQNEPDGAYVLLPYDGSVESWM